MKCAGRLRLFHLTLGNQFSKLTFPAKVRNGVAPWAARVLLENQKPRHIAAGFFDLLKIELVWLD